MSRRYAVVTFAAHELNGFTGLGRITEPQYRDAPEGPESIDADHGIILDLWDESACGVVENKCVGLETAAALLGWPADQLIQRGRQAAAAAEDEFRDLYKRRGGRDARQGK